MPPRISVLMSVYNSEKFLGKAVLSILDQTFTDFEFIIIDDNSTDQTPVILDGYSDPRIIRIRNEKNIGLTASLNKGIALTRGEYIARMDADDVSLPTRFEKQITYLENAPSIGVLGTWFQRIDDDGMKMETCHPPAVGALTCWALLFDNCLCHSSVIIRRAVIEQVGFYRPDYLFAQDYELWLRASRNTEISNLSEVLHLWRKGDGQISAQKREQQEYFALSAQRAAISRVLKKEVESIGDFRRAMSGVCLENNRAVMQVTRVILDLYRAFLRETRLDRATRRLIANDTADRLLVLVSKNMETAFWPSVYALVRAKMLDPHIPNLQTIKDTIRSGIHNTPISKSQHDL